MVVGCDGCALYITDGPASALGDGSLHKGMLENRKACVDFVANISIFYIESLAYDERVDHECARAVFGHLSTASVDFCIYEYVYKWYFLFIHEYIIYCR